MQKLLKIISLLLVIATVVFAAGCAEQGGEEAAEGAVEEVAEESVPADNGSDAVFRSSDGEMPTYVVGTEAQFPPFEIVDSKGNVIGFDVDLMNAIAEDQGFKVEYLDQDFAGLIPALQTGNVDIIASGMTITDEREEQVDFSEPYINAGLALAVLIGNEDIQSIDDLKGKTVAVQTGSTGFLKAEELQKAGIIAEIKDFPHVNEAIEELKIGGADAMINDLPVTEAFIAAQPDVIEIVGEPLNSEDYGFAVRTGNTELLTKINAGIENVKASGKYDELLTKLPTYMEE
ncbi:glutamine-binding protein [Methanosarcina sp. 2.H.T.1A.6]|uniref:basic amino acid ABC transporter substrate-binding protein n=1 Tax=unclassified Methanosarcina TaxID=2644672 RepID=UPI000622A5BA|nr:MULTISPECIES: basic amino acid ABC transporter substrate-binding protein [unclassified Methanosarcina]KKG13523.1 glutamine-binding protein [Methanosarcina sp. 2.H.T.1A.3]KKG19888.1 glutamine-binding protein [Methanosarcina sp. 2.H.T.1A.15]KKG24815.1 glutamine-binding protein [Methanosarcina sp. 2.H.T.1A.6]KKG26067.1 glutamine-binding protein [Methanosarcina sp. 2.H.T.1A.8]